MSFLYKLGIHLAQSAGCWFPNAFCWFVLNDEHQQTRPRFHCHELFILTLPELLSQTVQLLQIPEIRSQVDWLFPFRKWRPLGRSFARRCEQFDLQTSLLGAGVECSCAGTARELGQAKPGLLGEKLRGKKSLRVHKNTGQQQRVDRCLLHLEGQERSHLFVLHTCDILWSCARFRLSICLLRYIISTDMLEEMLSNTVFTPSWTVFPIWGFPASNILPEDLLRSLLVIDPHKRLPLKRLGSQ